MERHTVIGWAHTRGARRPFSMSLADRLMHLYVIGQTGVGKSTLMAHLARQDIEAGNGCILIDPHGVLAHALAAEFPNQTIYWDVADPACPYGYNPLSYVSVEHRPLLAAALIDAFKLQWIDAWGPRMEHLLRYALLALLDQPNADLRDVLPLFIDKDFRTSVIADIKDEQVRQFWKVEWKALRYDRALDGVSPIANKLGAFLSHGLVRRAVCEPQTPLRFRTIMDQGQCLIVNLATGRLGADAANVLGGLILSRIAQAGYSRATVPAENRRPVFVYIDEAPSFTSAALSSMLPQLRKFGVGLTLAHQYLEQFERAQLSAILGNVGSLLAFRVGVADAPLLAQQLGSIEPSDLLGLGNQEFFARVMINGQQSKAFTAYSQGELPNAKTADRQ